MSARTTPRKRENEVRSAHDGRVQLEVEGRDEEKYTTILMNRPPSEFMAGTIVLVLFITVHLMQAYPNAVTLELQEKGSTYHQQAIYSTASYPYMFKVIYAPVVDLYFIKQVGRCKTYIVGACTALSVMFFSLAPLMESIIEPSNVVFLTILQAIINTVIIFVQIASKTLIVKMFPESLIGRATVIMNIGANLGLFFGFNVFVPLNSKKWLNDNLFTAHPLTKPLITHFTMLMIMAIICFSLAVFMLVFIAEKITENDGNRQTCGSICKVIPRMFTQRNIRNLLIFCVLTKAFRVLITSTLGLKLLDAGLSRTTLVNIDTVTFPIGIIFNILAVRFIVKGRCMQYFLYSSMMVCIVTLFRLWVYLDYAENHNTTRTIYHLLFLSLLDNMIISSTFQLAFINLMAPQEIATTYITAFMCVINGAGDLPSTIGLEMVEQWPQHYNFMYLCSIGVQIAVLIGYVPYARRIDEYPPEAFHPNKGIINSDERDRLIGENEVHK